MEKESLQKEISELKKTINELNLRLSESESLKSNFISNIMNEIYNPFSSILTLSDNILSLTDENLSRSKEMATLIYKEAAKLDFHLMNIFMAATLEAGMETVDYSTTSFEHIQEEVVKKLKVDLISKEIKLITEYQNTESVMITTDVKKVILVVTNLISNSIKFCENRGEIKIKYSVIENIINIEVRDNGSGITSEEIEDIYNRFKRINTNINSVTGGTGLGLSVVKALIDLLEGNIEIINDNGTKVLIALPNQAGEIDKNEDDSLFDEEIF